MGHDGRSRQIPTEDGLSRVHVLLDHQANREKLLEELGSEYDLVDAGGSLTATDLILCDRGSIEAHHADLQEAKDEAHPVFLPVILLSSGEGVRYQYPELQDLIDDVVVRPVSNSRLTRRINHHLRLRQQTQILQVEKDQRRLKEDHYRRLFERAKEQTYDVILLDIHLKSEVGGVDVMKKIREIERCDEMPIAALTAYALPSDESKYLEEGFDGYIAKPFTRNNIRKKLAGLVGGTQP